MKQNITLSIDKALIRKSKIIAAQRETSVSKMLSDELEKLVQRTEQYELAKRRALANLNYFSWHVKAIEPHTILLASEIEERHVLSFWDSLIIATASQSNAEKILTEDLNHGQVIEGVLIENPFL